MQSDLYRCSECSTLYDRGTHIPKLIPTCGHTFCSECVSTMINKKKLTSCPLDNITLPSLVERSDQFPTNLLILQVLDLKMKRDFDTCEKHGEPKILVCTTDYSCICKICQDEHKDHTIKPIKEVKAEADAKMKQLQCSLDQYKAQTDEIERLFEGTKKSLATFFKNKFDEMRDALTRKEKELFQEIDHLLENERKTTNKKLNQNPKLKSRMETQICDLESNILNQRFFRTLLAKVPSFQAAEEIERLNKVSQGLEKRYELELSNFSDLMMSIIQEFKINNDKIPTSNSEPKKESEILKNDKFNKIAKNKNILSIMIKEDTTLVNLKESSEENAEKTIDFTNLNLFKQIGPVHLVIDKQSFTVDGGQASRSLWKLFGDVYSFIIPFASAGFQETNLTLICSDRFRETNQIKVFELKNWSDSEIPHNQEDLGWGNPINQDSLGSSSPKRDSWGSSSLQKASWEPSSLQKDSWGSSSLQKASWGPSSPKKDSWGPSSPQRDSWGSSSLQKASWGSNSPWGCSSPEKDSWGSYSSRECSSPKKNSILQNLPSQISQNIENLVTLDLDLRHTSVNDTDIEAFSITNYFYSSLKVFALNLSFTKITDKSIRILSTKVPVESLERLALFLAGCGITDSSIKYFCDYKKNLFKKIKAYTLDLSQTNLTEEAVFALQGFLPSMLSLNRLDISLGGLPITDIAVKTLLRSLKENIQSLEEFTFQLNSTDTSDVSIEYLSHHLLPSISSLKRFTLKLDKTQVTDQSLAGLCQNLLKISKNLEFLVLSVRNTKVTRKSIELLINSVNWGSLSQLKFVCIRLDGNEEIALMR